MKDRASSTEKKYTVAGYFEGIEDGHAIGWAFLKEQPDKRLKIDIFCQGSIVASGLANNLREDLEKAKIGDGRSLFKLRISDELYNNCAHTLTAKVAGTEITLKGGPLSSGRLVRKREFAVMPRSEALTDLAKLLSASNNETLQNRLEQFNLAFGMGSLLQETGRYDESEATWSVFERVLGETSLIFIKYGEARLLQGDSIGAREYFLKAIKLDPASPWGHIGLGNCFLVEGKFEDAEEAYKQARNSDAGRAVFKTFASSSREMHIINNAEKLLTDQKIEESLGLLGEEAFKEPHSQAIQRKHNEILCLLNIPNSPHLDIAIRAKSMISLLQMKTSSIEELIKTGKSLKTQSPKKQRSTPKDRK